MKKIAVSTVFILFFSSFSSSVVLGQGNFTDLQENNLFYDEIQFLIEKGVISGFPDRTLRPKAEVTRGQAAIMLGRALGYDGTPRESDFPDVNAAQAASGYIAEAVENGIMSGYPDGLFRPDATMNRGEMAIVLQRAFYPEARGGHYMRFPDVGTNMRAFKAIGILGSYGVVRGYEDGNFYPEIELNREQFSAFLARAIDPERFADNFATGDLKVIFLDVGQGDATYIEYPNGENALVDAGPSSGAILNALIENGIREIDTFIATHPDEEHIGGAAYVIENYGVSEVIDSGQTAANESYTEYQTAVEQSGAAHSIAEVGDDLSGYSDVSVQVLTVDQQARNLDDGSIVLKATFGEHEYLLASDVSYEVEDQLLAQGTDLDADVLKVSRHGGAGATSAEFLAAVNPFYSIVSVGKNAIEYPDEDVLDRILESTSAYIRTDDGTIRFTDNGEELEIFQIEY